MKLKLIYKEVNLLPSLLTSHFSRFQPLLLPLEKTTFASLFTYGRR